MLSSAEPRYARLETLTFALSLTPPTSPPSRRDPGRRRSQAAAQAGGGVTRRSRAVAPRATAQRTRLTTRRGSEGLSDPTPTRGEPEGPTGIRRRDEAGRKAQRARRAGKGPSGAAGGERPIGRDGRRKAHRARRPPPVHRPGERGAGMKSGPRRRSVGRARWRPGRAPACRGSVRRTPEVGVRAAESGAPQAGARRQPAGRRRAPEDQTANDRGLSARVRSRERP
jgi:hypothetical protein